MVELALHRPWSVHELRDALARTDSEFGFLLTIDDEVVVSHYSGGNGPLTRFRLFSSLSKPLTALAVLLLVQDGVVSPTTTLGDLGSAVARDATLWQLLTHTAAVPDVTSDLYFRRTPLHRFRDVARWPACTLMPLDDFVADVATAERAAPAGGAAGAPRYNNTGYDLLGYAIYLATGVATDEFVRRRVLVPLEMHHTGFHADGHPAEATPHEADGSPGVREQLNWFCANGFAVATLVDVDRFVRDGASLLRPRARALWHALPFCAGAHFYAQGSGDFGRVHLHRTAYAPLSTSCIAAVRRGGTTIRLVVAVNRPGRAPLLALPRVALDAPCRVVTAASRASGATATPRRSPSPQRSGRRRAPSAPAGRTVRWPGARAAARCRGPRRWRAQR